MALKLHWRRTWPDKPRDFACDHDGRYVGRIYHTQHPEPSVRWFWSYLGGNGRMPRSGLCATKDEAARLVEAAHFGEL